MIAAQELAYVLDDDRGDMTLLCHPGGEIVFVSPSGVAMTGWLASAMVRRNIDELVHPDDLDGVSAIRAAAIDSNEAVFVSTFRFLCGDGGYLWSEAVVRATRHPRDDQQPVVVMSVRDISDRKLVEARLERQALADPLTGLANRAVFADRLDHALRRLERTKLVVAVIYLDLDGFKAINDSLGHRFGDALLVAIAARAAAALRPADTLARVGGDEFVIIAEDLANIDEAVDLAVRTCAELERPFVVSGESVVCTASAGVTVTSDPTHSPDGLLQEADLALYRAKARGRNRAEVFDEQLRATAIGRLAVERTVGAAMEEDRLVVAYQPIVDLATGSCVSVEALVRIRDESSLVLPGDFIDVAEETGQVTAIDEHVVTGVLSHLPEWVRCQGFEGVSVNMSSRRLADPALAVALGEAIVAHDLPPGALTLELKEQTLLEASNSTAKSLHAIRSLGVRVSIDNFGAGPASLSALRRLPLDLVKIDPSLVAGLADSEQDRAVVAALVDLLHALGLVVVAKGVETEQQLEMLADMGCDRAQGFALGHPDEPSKITEILSGRRFWGARSAVVSGAERSGEAVSSGG
jgi:diguanylate cyclase (GGDEF)-like protein/PAS domain S-box-containing protein